MKLEGYTVSVFFDTRYPKVGTNMCPIVLSVNLYGKQFPVGLKLHSTREDYDKARTAAGGSAEVKELRKQITDYIDRADKILDRLPNPNKETFVRLFKSETDLFKFNKTDITFIFDEQVNMYKSEERIKTGENCENALKSLKRYRSNIYFEDIDEKFLKGYKTWMANQGNSATTAQIYLRNLRTVFNVAIKQGYVSEKHYPFKKFTIGTSAKSKSVLYPEQLKALWEHKPKTMRGMRSKDYFFFCYLMNGCNFKDAVYLQFKDLKAETLSFVREKTKNTNREADKQVVVYLHDELKRIIRHWGNDDTSPNSYVLPILGADMTAVQKEKRRKTHQRLANRFLNQIGKELGFEERLCLNLARHSMATKLNIDGTSINFISEMLGHSDIKVTQAYVKSLPTRMIKGLSESLMKFD